MPSLKKIWIVLHFEGNYLNVNLSTRRDKIVYQMQIWNRNATDHGGNLISSQLKHHNSDGGKLKTLKMRDVLE